MCGDFDDHEQIDDELFGRFIDLIKHFGVSPPQDTDSEHTRLDTEDERKEYTDELFRAGLTRCLNDATKLPSGERMDAVAGQAIVFGRLAGFLTAQLPPDSDLFRTVTGAVSDGYNEATSPH